MAPTPLTYPELSGVYFQITSTDQQGPRALEKIQNCLSICQAHARFGRVCVFVCMFISHDASAREGAELLTHFLERGRVIFFVSN